MQAIEQARSFLEIRNILGEIIVVDNNSHDRSADFAEEAGARVVVEERFGYGSAIQAGIYVAEADYIILGDGDGQHDFGSLDLIWEKLLDGFDLVIGNRFSGNIHYPRSMSFWLRYMGSFVLSGIGRLLSRVPINDFHCGLRAFSTASVRNLGLKCLGMECASEMIIKAAIMNMSIVEVPVTQYPAMDPERRSHLRIWRDGWLHLCVLLKLYPRLLIRSVSSKSDYRMNR